MHRPQHELWRQGIHAKFSLAVLKIWFSFALSKQGPQHQLRVLETAAVSTGLTLSGDSVSLGHLGAVSSVLLRIPNIPSQ